MRSDLNRLMTERDLAAFIIPITEHYSPALHYLTGSIGHGLRGLALQKAGGEPILIVDVMEVEEAAAGGLQTYTLDDFHYTQLFEQAEGDGVKANVALWGAALEKIGVASGRVGVYGVGDFHTMLALFPVLQQTYPDYAFVGESGQALFDVAASSKDAVELERVKSVAKRTDAVWQATWDFIAGHRAEGDSVVKADGAPLTIGDVRRFVRLSLMEQGLEDTGLIFAQGRDAGIPHSRGQDDMPLKLGQAIVFDLFPREIGGGYHHDSTRTWSIGYATDDVRQTYETVMEAFDIAIETVAPNKPTHIVQEAVQQYFESKGHPTARSHPGTAEGYMHGLGHGVGIQIHEHPRMSHLVLDHVFETGNVVAIEPGLYYPEKGYGVRIEDTFYLDEHGSLIALTGFHKDLVLPLKGA